MKKLTSEHLAHYLPYGLIVSNYEKKYRFRLLSLSISGDIDIVQEDIEWNGENHCAMSLEYKGKPQIFPILSPLAALTENELIPIGLMIRDISISAATMKDKLFAVGDARMWIRGGMRPVLSLLQTRELMTYLFSIHGDVFGLIEEGLAIDINTLKQKIK